MVQEFPSGGCNSDNNCASVRHENRISWVTSNVVFCCTTRFFPVLSIMFWPFTENSSLLVWNHWSQTDIMNKKTLNLEMSPKNNHKMNKQINIGVPLPSNHWDCKCRAFWWSALYMKTYSCISGASGSSAVKCVNTSSDCCLDEHTGQRRCDWVDP